jgi:hypothetical protein
MTLIDFKRAVAGAALLLFGSAASADTWQVGWKGIANGSIDFYGVSNHTLSASADDFGVTSDFPVSPSTAQVFCSTPAALPA